MVDKTGFLNMPTRQKIMAGIVLIILMVIVWQVVGLFTGGGSSSIDMSSSNKNAPNGQASAAPPPQQVATLPKPTQLTAVEAQLLQLQQETQAKYIAALNELQMLKIQKDIATNQRDIMKARQDTVSAQKNIVDMLAPSGPTANVATYAQNLVSSGGASAGQPQQQGGQGGLVPNEARYTVISVSLLQHKWGAVLGYQGSLYSVKTGDILPADDSIVVSIDKSGVVLEKNGVKRLVSLVPII